MAKSKMRKGVYDSANSGKEIFSIHFDAFRAMFGKQAKGYDSVKVANSLGDALESISVEIPAERDKFNRELKDGINEILLTETQHAMLKKMVESEEVEWGYRAGKKLIKAIDHLKDWKEVEVEETK